MRAQMLMTALALTGCAFLPPSAMPSLSAASDAYFSASRSADTDAAASLLANDHLFIGTTGEVQDKAARVAWLTANQDWLPSVTAQDVVIKQYGQTGRVTGVWVIPDSGKTLYERFIHVWSLQGDQWQMISHQVTEISKPDAGGQ